MFLFSVGCQRVIVVAVFAASEIVNVTQPSLTRSLQKLEDILGVQLFDRTKNTISLNQTGRLAVDYARRILALQNEMENEVLDFYNTFL